VASIAKLSILVTTDTRLMSAGLRRAQSEMSGFGQAMQQQLDSAIAKWVTLEKGVRIFTASLRIARNVLKEFITEGAKLQTEIAKIGGGKDALGALDTEMRRFQRSTQITGFEMANLAAKVLNVAQNMADMVRMAQGLKSLDDTAKAIDGWEKWAKTATDRMKFMRAQGAAMAKERQEQMRRLQEKEAEAREQARERLRDEARSLEESLRTPLESLEVAALQLQELLQGRFI